MKKLKYKILIVLLSIKWMFRVNCLDEVMYQGKKYVVLNGVKLNSWRLNGLNLKNEGWVFRSDCKKIKTISNLIGSFKSGYSFYMLYWYKLWVENGIKPWMRKCKIW